MKFRNTITIERSPAEVFAYLADFEKVPTWNYAIAETRKISEGPVGAGTRYRQARRLLDPARRTSRSRSSNPESASPSMGRSGRSPVV